MRAIVESNLLLMIMSLLKVDFYRIEVKNGRPRFYAYAKERLNKEINFINVSLDGKITRCNENGVAVISAKILKLIGKNETLDITESTIKSSSGLSIKYKSLEDDFKEYVVKKDYVCEINDFSSLVTCMYAISKGDYRQELNCIGVNGNSFYTCDGYRLSKRSQTSKISDSEILIPPLMVNVIKKLNKRKFATIIQDENAIEMNFGDINIIANKFNYKFLNIDSLVPSDFNTKINIDIEDLKKIINKIPSSDKYCSNYLKLKLNENSKLIYTENKFNFEVEYDLKTNSFEGEEIEICLNNKYLKEMIKDYTGYVTMNLVSPMSPVVINQLGKLDMMLPIRIMRE